jgi:hypothetical protein
MRAAQRAKREYNLVMIHPDGAEGGVESWTAGGNVERMREHYKGWNTVLVTPFLCIFYAHAHWWRGTQCSKASGAYPVDARLEVDGPRPTAFLDSQGW